jgi:hypothetical protein
MATRKTRKSTTTSIRVKNTEKYGPCIEITAPNRRPIRMGAANLAVILSAQARIEAWLGQPDVAEYVASRLAPARQEPVADDDGEWVTI